LQLQRGHGRAPRFFSTRFGQDTAELHHLPCGNVLDVDPDIPTARGYVVGSGLYGFKGSALSLHSGSLGPLISETDRDRIDCILDEALLKSHIGSDTKSEPPNHMESEMSLGKLRAAVPAIALAIATTVATDASFMQFHEAY
jgi:hypothetical protein